MTSSDILSTLPPVRGDLIPDADIAKGTWFRVGGRADLLFKPADEDDLSAFLTALPDNIPVTILGLGSNVIIRDGGLRGVVIKLGKAFASIVQDNDDSAILTLDAGAADAAVARFAADRGLGGLDFLIGIPGNIGGAVRMNAGAYGTEIADVLVDCRVMARDGTIKTYGIDDITMGYRHNDLPEDGIILSARVRGTPEDPERVKTRLAEIKQKREETQPVKERTGGSTFANPQDHDLKAWQMIDAVGGRGFHIGGAKISEKHCNFMINTGTATAADLEELGEEMCRRVQDRFGIALKWEIRRIGEKKKS